MTKVLEVRAAPGKEGFVEDAAVEWPWATPLAENHVRVIGGDVCDESPMSKIVKSVLLLYSH